MNERLKVLRKELGLTQEEFALRIGLTSKGTISAFENGTRQLTERVINDICREFYVNDKWFRNGDGYMFMETSELDRMLYGYNLSFLDRELIKEYIHLPSEARKAVLSMIKDIAKLIPDNFDESIKRASE